MKKLDLYNSASACALDTLAEPAELALEQKTIARFTTENLNPLDWPVWKDYFGQQRARFLQLKDQDAPSVQKAIRAAPVPLKPSGAMPAGISGLESQPSSLKK